MVFSSLLFVFLFLPLNLAIYKIVPTLKGKNIVMLIFSLIFYACGEPVYILLLVGMALADWYISKLIGKEEIGSNKAKLLLALACVVDLGLLCIFKYATFILENIQYFSGFPKTIPSILLPIGISFYTFQLLSYVIDVYKGKVEAQNDFFTLLLYVSLFHQCIAGPIVRYRDVRDELNDRRVSAIDMSQGVIRFTVGLAKKAVLANSCSAVASALLVSEDALERISLLEGRSVLSLWIGMLAYTLFIYLDFSAYSDMAIGMGLMIGIHYHENFNYPYIASSVTDFWHRWHISLSTFFRDYVYIPLGGSRKGFFRTILNLLVVWALTGLWHGASWNFVLWGLYYFVFAVLERLFLRKLLEKAPKAIRHIYVLIVVMFGWMLFRFTDLNELFVVIKGLFGANGNSFWSIETGATLGSYIFILLFSCVAATPLFKRIENTLQGKAVSNAAIYYTYAIIRILLPVILLLLSTAALVGNSYNPFLYFRF